MMQPKSFPDARSDSGARALVSTLVLGLWTLTAPNPMMAEELNPPANFTSFSDFDLVSDASGVNLATEGLMYVGNVFDYHPDAGWMDIDLAFFVEPHRFETGSIRLWIHSARRGASNVEEETLLYDQVLELSAEQTLLPGDIWFNVPYIPSIWYTLPLALSGLVPPSHDLLAIGFVIDIGEAMEKRFLPAFSCLGYTSAHEEVPLESSIFSDVYGDVQFGLSWEYLLTRFPENYLDSAEPSFKENIENMLNKVGSTHIRIHVRP